MKIKDMKSILASNKFDNCECNFKIKSKGPQAPEWFKQFYAHEFKPLQEAFIKSQTEAPKWFQVYMTAFEQKINQRFDQLEARIDHLEHRIDNLVSKNNLKE